VWERAEMRVSVRAGAGTESSLVSTQSRSLYAFFSFLLLLLLFPAPCHHLSWIEPLTPPLLGRVLSRHCLCPSTPYITSIHCIARVSFFPITLGSAHHFQNLMRCTTCHWNLAERAVTGLEQHFMPLYIYFFLSDLNSDLLVCPELTQICMAHHWTNCRSSWKAW
jgi:hypothetical protein